MVVGQPLPPTATAGTSSAVQSTLNPNVLPFVSSIIIDDEVPSQTAKTKARSNKVKNKANSDLTLEYAKYEVNITQAKIRDQEVVIKDLRFKNNLLEARVADLEKRQKQDIYERYFPKPDVSASSGTEPNKQPDSGSCCPRTSHLVLSCCNNSHQHQSSDSLSSPAIEKLTKEVTNRMDAFKSDMDHLKCRIDILSEVSVPQTVRETLCTGISI